MGKRMESQEVRRSMKDMSHTGLKTNDPTDFLDYRYSYYIPVTKEKIEKAVEKFLTEIAEILDADREEAREKGLHIAAGLERTVQPDN